MGIKTPNDHVAVKPFVFDHEKGNTQQTVKGFVGTDKLSKTIITSAVVFESKTYKPGQTLYFRADIYNIPQAKNVLTIENQEFILIPESFVVAVKE